MGLVVGTNVALRWLKWLFDSVFTIGAVAVISMAHLTLDVQFVGQTTFLLSLLAVMISATRGGFMQGVFATFLSLALEIFLWGDWRWLVPSTTSPHFLELFLYVVEGLLVSYFAEFYLNGRLALRHSQTRFQVLFNAIPVGAIIHYKNKIYAANETFAEMFGYQPHEMIGAKPSMVVAPESVDESGARINVLSEEGNLVTVLRRNGLTFPVEVISRNINYQDRPMRITVMRDLTEHQRLEQLNERLEELVLERTGTLNSTVAYLSLALDNVKKLTGLLPMCGSCKRIRDDDGYWSQVEEYISAHSSAEFSHSLCPECLTDLRDEIKTRQRRQTNEPAN